ncbi:hypothetical protein ACFQ2B_38225 [Streptomyces stramineus]
MDALAAAESFLRTSWRSFSMSLISFSSSCLISATGSGARWAPAFGVAGGVSFFVASSSCAVDFCNCCRRLVSVLRSGFPAWASLAMRDVRDRVSPRW